MKTMLDFANKIKPYFQGVAGIEPTATASEAHAKGKKFYLNGALVEATANIAIGDTITVGTNVEVCDDLSTEVTSLKETLTNQINENGVKNLLNFPLGTKTSEGIAYTVQADKSITAVGTLAAGKTSQFDFLYIDGTENYIGEDVIFSGCPSGGSQATYCLVAYRAGSVDGSGGSYFDTGDGVAFTFLNNASGTPARLRIQITNNGASAISVDKVFYPMIRLASDPDGTYEPYAMTNQELTTDKVGMDLLSEVGAVNYFNNTATSQVVKGITYTVNADKTVSATGTNDGTGASTISVTRVPLKKGTYKCSGSPSGGSSTTYGVNFDVNSSNNNWDYGEGKIITLSADGYVDVYMSVRTSYAISGTLTFKPMITPVEYNGPYAPYAKTNRELTEFTSKKISFDCTVRSNRGTIVEQNNFRVGNTVFISIKAIPNISGNIPFLTIPSGFRPIKPSNSPYVSTILNAHNLDYTNRDYVNSIINSDSGEVDLYGATANATYIISGVYYCEQ